MVPFAVKSDQSDEKVTALNLRAELASGRLSGDELLDAWYHAGRELYFASRLDEAREWLERVVKTKEDYLDAKWYHLDTLRRHAAQTTYPFWDAGRLRQARELWVDAVARRAPQQDAAWAFITGALLADGEGQLHPATARSAFSWEALTYLERALLLDDKNQYAWIHISRQHRSLGNYGNTAVATEEAFALAPDDLEVLDERLALRGDKGDTPGAKELLDERLRRDPSTWAQGVKAYVHNLEGNLLQAVDQVTLVMESEPDDLWNRTFRCDCLRQLAVQAKDEQQRNEYWKRAYADCEWILEKRGNPNYTSQELTFAAAAQALGRIDLAIELVSPLLPEPLDPAGNSHRLLGCCYLQRGEIEGATRHLERGIDGATSFANLKVTRDVLLAEIEARCSGWPHEAEVRRLLPSLYDRIDKAYSRVAAPSPEAELRRALEWDASDFPGAPWAHAAAAAGLARLATRAGRWSDAAQAYRSLSGDPRFPEAAIGANHVAERAAQSSKASSV
jgi:tetratricopeptide (TPR) repeat protein